MDAQGYVITTIILLNINYNFWKCIHKVKHCFYSTVICKYSLFSENISQMEKKGEISKCI